MQFSSIIVLSVLAAVASSTPAPAGPVADTQASAEATLKTFQANGCNYLECVSALAGETATCAAAAAEGGANFVADLACFSSVSGNIGGDACNGCF